MIKLPFRDGEFRGPRAKINRAKRHLVEVSDMIEQMKLQHVTSIVKITTEASMEFRIIDGGKSETSDLSSAVGDILHNIRSALDQTIAELVRINGHSDKDVYFPFCENVNDLDRMIEKRRVHLAGSDTVDLVKSLRPYKGGNVPLRAIHDYNIMDKHRNIISISQSVASPKMGIGKDADPDGTVYNCCIDFNLIEFSSLNHTPVVHAIEVMMNTAEQALESLYALARPAGD